MLVLHTKDGSRVGNAILCGGETTRLPPDYQARKLFFRGDGFWKQNASDLE